MAKSLLMPLKLLWIMGSILALTFFSGQCSTYLPSSSVKPPAPEREFRGVWVATVGNINWPSKPGLTTAQQRAELVAILDRAVSLKLNTVIFQVRPACDALYSSKLEPWSEYLTGIMGQAPKPAYDPLAFAIQEAHKRGLELHAWFNPFRARFHKQISPPSAGHVSRRQPQLVKAYAKFLWLDPGDPAVHDYSLRVILDVVQRYDIDGVHLDDYFYPYPELDARRNVLAFPDSSSWTRYRNGGGKLSREDWRRDNVNRFLKKTYQAIKAEKAHVKFGLSPFGIWRPGFPAQIRGFDPYEQLFADSRRWLVEGYLDYLAPQLYWNCDAPAQSFPVLLNWWAGQNPQKRHLFSGISLAGTDGRRVPAEVVNQIRLTRKQTGAAGHVFWSMGQFMQNKASMVETLNRETYTQQALIPAYPWLDSTPPAAPKVKAGLRIASNVFRVSWTTEGTERPHWWVVQVKNGNQWSTQILPGSQKSMALAKNRTPDHVAVTAVDRCGNLSVPAVLERAKE